MLRATLKKRTSAATPSPACALVRRNPVSGSLWLTSDSYVIDLPTNVGGVKTSGIEVNGSYAQPIGRAEDPACVHQPTTRGCRSS